MRMYDLIEKKKKGFCLTGEEISYMVQGYVKGEIPDYQIAAILMAIYFQGMTKEELTGFTMEMAQSGDMIDLSEIHGFTVDKHSTGGVGDKTTLITAPIVAALGVKVAKMSGRGLGHTGGTIDKLESIPGFQTAISKERFFEIVNKIGVSVIGQTGNIVPADKKIYALRDVTATVDSMPLIASSIMSKKLASGSQGIVLDVKTGSGAFMKTVEDSIHLAKEMVAIGCSAGRECCALVTDMDVPLGSAIGNALEVKESVEVLQGKGPNDLKEVSLRLASYMLYLAGKGSPEFCYQLAERTIEDGSALKMLAEMVKAQGGDETYILKPEKFSAAEYKMEIIAKQDGWIIKMDAEQCGSAAVLLGAGRDTKDAEIDPLAGILLYKKYGEYVKKGDLLALICTSDQSRLRPAGDLLFNVYTIGSQAPEMKKLVYAVVTKTETITQF